MNWDQIEELLSGATAAAEGNGLLRSQHPGRLRSNAASVAEQDAAQRLGVPEDTPLQARRVHAAGTRAGRAGMLMKGLGGREG
jgi:hypothetical protein